MTLETPLTIAFLKLDTKTLLTFLNKPVDLASQTERFPETIVCIAPSDASPRGSSPLVLCQPSFICFMCVLKLVLDIPKEEGCPGAFFN